MKVDQKVERSAQEFVIPDVLWQRIEPLLPVREKPVHPLGCHRGRTPDREAMNGIFYVLRTGCQWKALDATGICSGSTAHARFQEWTDDGFFVRLWEAALQDFDEVQGLDWEWLALDGAMTKARVPFGRGGGKKRPQSHRSRQKRHQAQPADGSLGHSRGSGGCRCESS